MVDTRKMIAFAGSVAMLAGVAACGNSNSAGGGDQTSGDAQQEITVWAWEPTLKDVAKKFEAKYPNIKVNLQNVGTNIDEYTQLTNALEAGNGAPDVAQIEYYALPEYAIKKQLKELSGFGAKDYADYYTPGTWAQVQFAGGIYGLPMDSGPMAFFYNKEVFDKAGVDATQIKTWDDYYEAAKKIHALGDNYYITNNSGDANAYQPFTAQAWQAGAQPWKVDGENITINMTEDSGMKKYIDFQQKLIDEGLVNTSIANWSDDWNRSLNDGTTASLVIGGWMPTNLESGAPDQAGNWRVAPLPQWNEGDQVSAEDGGSALAMPEQSKNKEAAYKFLEFLTHGDGAQVMADNGTFPSLKKILNDSDFQSVENEYFGGQQVNKVLCEAANLPVTEFQYLPYNPYAQSQYGDAIAPAYQGKTTLKEAFANYAKLLGDYGTQQGYKVTVK